MTVPTVEVASRTTTLGGLRVHYLDSGDPLEGPTGEVVVLLHGVPQTSRMWGPVIDALAARHRVLAPDLRGSGGSQATATGYDKATLAGDLDRLLEHVGVNGAVSVVGHDMGAGVAYAFAAARPDRVRRLVFAEFVLPGFGFAEAAAPAPDHENWQLGFFASAPDMAERLFTGREQDLVTWYLGHGAADPDAVDPDDLAHYTRQLCRPGALHATMAYFASTWADAEHNLVAARRPLPMPVLALGGARSAAGGAAASIARVADHVETVVVDEAGHWLVDEQPSATTAAITAFLHHRSEELHR